MARRKLSTAELLRRVDAGESFADIAKEYGVSRQAIQKRVRALRGKTTKAVVAGKVQRVVDQRLDAIQQLERINQTANRMLEDVIRTLSGEAPAIDPSSDCDPPAIRDPHKHALALMAEIRCQLSLQLQIFQALFDLKAAQEFQEEVLQAIGEVSEDVRKQIIHRLNQKRAVRSAVRFS